MTLLSLSAPALLTLMVELPEKTPNRVPSVTVTVVPIRFRFLTVLLVAPAPTPVLSIQTTADAVPALELVSVVSRLVPAGVPPPFEPLIVTQSAPFRLTRQVALL